MAEPITLEGVLTGFDEEPLAGVRVVADPRRPVVVHDGGVAIKTTRSVTAKDDDPDPTGSLNMPLVWAEGLSYRVYAEPDGILRELGILDCDAHAPGSAVNVKDLPPATAPADQAVDALWRAWVREQLALLDPATLQQFIEDYLTDNPPSGGVTDHEALTGRDATDQHPIGAVTGLQAALDSKAPDTHNHDGTYATTDQGAKADTAVQPAQLAAETQARTDADTALAAEIAGHSHDVGSTDHGELDGLDHDDHTQYALADGSRGAFAPPLGPDDNYVTDAEKAALHSHANQAALDNVSGVNTGDQTLPTWTTIAGKPTFVAEGPTAADARTAIGAGTSSFSGDYDDLTDKPTLGDAAAKNTGTTAGTVAAGDDSRITGAAQKSANLSDLADAGTARTNLGLGTAATTAASAYATAAQGALAESALQVATAQPINAQTGTAYTLVASDAGKLVTLTNAAAITLNAPGSVFTAGQRVDVVVLGAGMATVVGTSGATANGTPTLVSRAQYSAFTVVWLSATSAVVVGDMAAA